MEKFIPIDECVDADGEMLQEGQVYTDENGDQFVIEYVSEDEVEEVPVDENGEPLVEGEVYLDENGEAFVYGGVDEDADVYLDAEGDPLQEGVVYTDGDSQFVIENGELYELDEDAAAAAAPAAAAAVSRLQKVKNFGAKGLAHAKNYGTKGVNFVKANKKMVGGAAGAAALAAGAYAAKKYYDRKHRSLPVKARDAVVDGVHTAQKKVAKTVKVVKKKF